MPGRIGHLSRNAVVHPGLRTRYPVCNPAVEVGPEVVRADTVPPPTSGPTPPAA